MIWFLVAVALVAAYMFVAGVVAAADERSDARFDADARLRRELARHDERGGG